MRNLGVGKKFAISFGCIIVLFFFTTITSIISLFGIGNNYTQFYEVNHQAQIKAYDARIYLQLAVKNVIMSTLTTDASLSHELLAESDRCFGIMTDSIAWFDTEYTGDTTAISQFTEIMDEVEPIRQQIHENCQQNTSQSLIQAQTLLVNSYNPKIVQAGILLEQFSKEIDTHSQKTYSISLQLRQGIFVMLATLSILTLCMTIFFAFRLTHLIVRPLREISSGMHKIVNGDLSLQISYESKDELGELAEDMRQMCHALTTIVEDENYILSEMASGNFNVRTRARAYYVGDFSALLDSMRHISCRLSETMSQIHQAAKQVSTNATQVSSGSQSLANGTTEQASSIEELSATLTDISLHIGDTAEHAQIAQAESNKVQSEAQDSNQRMQDMLHAMQDISDGSHEIEKIIKTIEDIAFQTNILALNAAVEAARAGSAGKGFAVVADEVRNLASKSAEASQNTSTLITRSLQAVKNGTQIADATAQSLHTVLAGIEKVAVQIQRISEATCTQSDSINQLAGGVDNISDVVQHNAATSEESAAVSEELSSQAELLHRLVSQFNFRADLFTDTSHTEA